MSKLVSPEGKILIPGVNDLIAPLTDDEQKKFNDIHFKIEDIHGAIGGDQTLTSDPVKTLMGRMRELKELRINPGIIAHHFQGNPSLSLHGIEGAFCTYHCNESGSFLTNQPLLGPKLSFPARSRASSRSAWSPTLVSRTRPSWSSNTSTRSSRRSAPRIDVRLT